MPVPATPSLVCTPVSSTSFTAACGVGAGDTARLFYQTVGSAQVVTGPTRAGPGDVTVSGVAPRAQLLVWLVSDDGSAVSLPAIAAVSLASNDTLSAAIHSRWNASSPLVALVTGGLWTGEVPEGTAPPYCWLELPKTVGQPYFIDRFDKAVVTFHTYAVGAETAERCALQIQAVFDEQTLTWSANNVWTVSVIERMYRLVCEGTRYKDNKLMFRTIQNYEVHIQRQRS